MENEKKKHNGGYYLKRRIAELEEQIKVLKAKEVNAHDDYKKKYDEEVQKYVEDKKS